MEYIVVVVLVAVVTLVAWRRPVDRRQLIWGAVFSLPVMIVNLAFAGSIDRLGITTLDEAVTLLTTFIGLAASSALAALLYELTINRWVTPQRHYQRNRLGWLALGLAVTLLAWSLGASPALAIIIGLCLNTASLFFISFGLFWDALVSAAGLAFWYAFIDALIGLRTSGDIARFLIGPEPIGITISGLPIERVIIIAGVGALCGPIFAALKQYRQPQIPIGKEAAPMNIAVSASIVLGLALFSFWFNTTFVQAPRPLVIAPSIDAMNVRAATTIRVQFDHPVNRDALRLVIDPPAEGTWSFSKPIAGKHGFRRAVFTFETTLLPGTTYIGQIVGIKSVWGLAGSNQTFRFRTLPLPDVESASGVPFGDSAAATPATPIDPCHPVTVGLTNPTDDSSELSFFYTPPAPLEVALSNDRLSYELRGQPCIAANTTYQLRIERQTTVRDPATKEIIAASIPEIIYETKIITGPNSKSASSPPLVLAAVAASGQLIPVRPQKILSVTLDYQDQPLSCEAASLKMALAAQRVKVSENQIMKIIGYDPTPHRKGIWGDPNKAFVGNIAGKQNTTGYGVYWSPIKRAAVKWRSATVITNGHLTDLTKAIDAGHAVVVWGTMGNAWRDGWKTPTGKTIPAWKGEHARTVIGYIGTAAKPTRFVINDPIAGRLIWTAETLIQNWARFQNSGVIVE